MFSRQHYNAVAESLKNLGGAYSSESIIQDGIEASAKALAITFQADNSSFDETRFLVACGVLPNV